MGRGRVPGLPGPAPRVGGGKGRRTRREAGPEVIARGGVWHVQGTVTAGGKSCRIRRSTGLPALDVWLADAAQLRRDWERQAVDELLHGIRPSETVAAAARHFLGLDARGRPIPGAPRRGAREVEATQDAAGEFGPRLLNGITPEEWRGFLRKRHAGNAADTRTRYESALRSFLAWCAAEQRGWLAALPVLAEATGRKPGNPPSARRRQRRRVAELRPDLLAFLIDHGSIHLRAQLYVEWSTGARVSSILFGCAVEDLVLTPNRRRITFHATKNDDDVTAELHEAVVPVLEDYLRWRGNLHQRAAPLFVTPRVGRDGSRLPYSRRGHEAGAGGQNKTAFKAMRRRAIRAKLRESVRARRAGDAALADALRADARLLRQVTQHWLRHWLATFSMALGMPRRLVMAQGGWRDERSLDRYEHDVEEVRRRAVAALPIGTPARTAEGGIAGQVADTPIDSRGKK